MMAMGLTRYLRDGSMWLDEASIAYNLLVMSPAELFGPLETGHRFPRLYLAAINGLGHLFEHRTMALRFLPIVAFAAGVVAYQHLLLKRWRSEIIILVLGILLTLIPGTWFAYGAMLKQYSLDFLLALVPFLLGDRFYDDCIRRGKGRWRIVLLIAPALLSFTYVVPLLGRILGWWIAGLRQAGPRVDLVNCVGLGAGLMATLGVSWQLDLQYTYGNTATGQFWQACTMDADPLRSAEIVRSYLTGWYAATPPFGGGIGVPFWAGAVLLAAFAAGCGQVIWRLVFDRPLGAAPRPTPSASETVESSDDWGSRSVGCFVTLLGVVGSGMLVGYPICAGRITLFSFLALQILTLEGLALVMQLAGRWPSGRHVAQAAVALLALVAMPASLATVRTLLFKDGPENVRPLLPLIATRPELPVLVAACSTRQIETLPEARHMAQLHYFDHEQGWGESGYPDAREFWVLGAGSNFYCPWFYRSLSRQAESFTIRSGPQHTASLVLVKMPGEPSK
jgi:hypothetical protein